MAEPRPVVEVASPVRSRCGQHHRRHDACPIDQRYRWSPLRQRRFVTYRSALLRQTDRGLGSTHRSELELTQKIFNTATVTVSGLYFSTHSVVVTLIGTAIPSLLAGHCGWHIARIIASSEGVNVPIHEAVSLSRSWSREGACQPLRVSAVIHAIAEASWLAVAGNQTGMP